MIIYEVNILIPKSIYKDYLNWLKIHIEEMLSFDGFIKSKSYLIKTKDTTDKELCVHYYIESMKHYDSYLTNNAKKMRSNKFADKINIKRRLLALNDL